MNEDCCINNLPLLFPQVWTEAAAPYSPALAEGVKMSKTNIVD